ncbi:hypothetical protein TWF281_004427 [Arthrobotrys megalospora]
MALNTLQLACIAVPILGTVILSLPPSSFIRQCLYPLPAWLLIQPIIWPPKVTLSDDDEGVAQGIFLLGIFYMNILFVFSDYLYLQGYNTPRYFYRVHRHSRSDGGGDIYQREGYPENDWWGRIKWAVALVTSPRGVGWNFQVPLPETQYPTSWATCTWQSAMTLLKCHILSYITREFCGFLVRVLRNEEAAAAYPIIYDVFSKEAVQMVIICAAWIVRIITFVNLTVLYPKIICVGFGIGGSWRDPKAWPRMFGYFEDCWSVRSMWGKAWHSYVRRCIQAPGDRIADLVFGADPSGLPRPLRILRRYFLLFSAFAISGLIHTSGLYFLVVGADSTPAHNPPWYYTFYFFVGQALFITVEDFACWVLGISNVGEEVKGRKGRWVFGVGYTLVWFIWSVPVLWVDPETRVLGFWRGEEGFVHVLDRVARF